MIGVVGAGAFGTALALSQASEGARVILWGRDRQSMDRSERERRSARLPNLDLPSEVSCTGDLGDLAEATALLLAIPAQKTEAFLAAHAEELPDVPLVMCAKGIGATSLKLQTEIAAASAPGHALAALTGPGFAGEIAMGLPTALTLACTDRDLGRRLQAALSHPRLRLYLTDDVAGVQLGGALKNVIAIACGMADGAHLGASARAALMTRGFAEMNRLAMAFGARRDTLSGLSGFGDLSLTCNSPQSRNYMCGLAIGQGTDRAGGTVEGVATARAACKLAARHAVEMPIAAAVADVLEGHLTLGAAMDALLARPLKEE
ncbi:MAG: NAD(P)H-dependent glycerol-3-phosphate dehydrogenase [Pseudomonadota bacterium]